MHKELKKAIINWLIDNENKHSRISSCKTEFRNYIFDENSKYLIGGKEVKDFILEADRFLYYDEHEGDL